MSQSGVTLCASTLSNNDNDSDSQSHFFGCGSVNDIRVVDDVTRVDCSATKGPEMGGKIDVGRFLGIDGTWFLSKLGASSFYESEQVS